MEKFVNKNVKYEYIHESFGLTKERVMEITNKIIDTYISLKDRDTKCGITTMFEEILPMAKNFDEQLFIAKSIGQIETMIFDGDMAGVVLDSTVKYRKQLLKVN